MVCTGFQRLLFLCVTEFLGFSGAIPYNQKCYNANGESMCFFQHVDDTTRPQFLWRTWNQADQICRNQNGTLPILLSEIILSAFQEYVESLLLNNYENMWMAGREVKQNQWIWISGRPFTLRGHIMERNSGKSEHDHAILTDKLEFQVQSPSVKSNYICKYFGSFCQSSDAFHLKHGCLLLNNQETLNFYDARNRCLRNGGDLAVIENEDDRQQFKKVFSKFGETSKLWIGLRKQWWKWKTNTFHEIIDVKYSNWESDEGFKTGLQCMTISPKTYKWNQFNCDVYMRFICQTGPNFIELENIENKDRGNVDSSYIVIATTIAGVLFLILIVAVVAAIILIVNKKRKSWKSKSQSENSYQDLANEIPQPNTTDKYTKLQLPLRPNDLQTKQQTASPETAQTYYKSLYDEIDYIQGPCYLELQQSL